MLCTDESRAGEPSDGRPQRAELLLKPRPAAGGSAPRIINGLCRGLRAGQDQAVISASYLGKTSQTGRP
jgi:hypothetical protein